MSRLPLFINDFSKGISLRADMLTKGDFLRMSGYKMGDRLGSLTTRGGFDSWDLGADFTYIQGFKRWYRQDGLSIDLLTGNDGVGQKVFEVNLNNRSASTLTTLTEVIDPGEPVSWVECDDQLILIYTQYSGRPLSIKTGEYESFTGDRGLIPGLLGLDAPTVVPQATAYLQTLGLDVYTTASLLKGKGTHKYYYSWSYGTPSNPEQYGESALSSMGEVYLSQIFDASNWYIVQVIVPALSTNSLVRRTNIYRTLVDGDTPYKIGEITEPGQTAFNDSIGDTEVDISATAPIYTGLPSTMTCARWHPVLKRLFWCGTDGYFHYSAAGFPDINPTNQRLPVGSTGYPSRSIWLIRNNIYVFKEDGIFLVSGDAPNYTSKSIVSIKVLSRNAIVEMPDGIYFLGSDSGGVSVFKFDGNSITPLSANIEALLTRDHHSLIQKTFAKKVGNEFWLSIPCNDKRYVAAPQAFNNVIFPYDYRYKAWMGSFIAQASSIEVFDGPGDRGEIFITESDPYSNASKGNLFKHEPNIFTTNASYYTSGTKQYSQTYSPSYYLTTGVTGGISSKEIPSLEKITGYTFRVRCRGNEGKTQTFNVYGDGGSLEAPISTGSSTEPLDITSLIPALNKFGTTYGTGKYIEAYVEDLFYSVSINDYYTGIIFELALSYTTTQLISIEAIEGTFTTTEQD